MDKEQLKNRVKDILASAWDDEAAHSMEDKLNEDLIDEFCPDWVKAEIKRVREADFNRWCA